MNWPRPKHSYFTSVTRWAHAILRNAHLALCTILTVVVMHSTVFAKNTLVVEDVQLRGAQSRHSIALGIGGTKPQAVEINLQLAASPLLDNKRSIVNILVNGQIRSTRRVEDLVNGSWRVNLRPLAPGKHELSFQAYLRGKDDDCIPLPESLWLTLLNTSTIDGAHLLTAPTANSTQAVRDFPNIWKQASSVNERLGKDVKTPVVITHDFAWSNSMGSAWLQAQLLLANRGLVVHNYPSSANNQPSVGTSTASLTLRTFDRLPANHPAAIRWREIKDPIYVLFAPSPSKLEVIAKKPEHLQLALDLLDDDERRQICHQNVCSLSSSDLVKPLHANRGSRPNNKPMLWSMATGDQPRGWTAQGVGTHRLRQVWVRPLAMELQSDVQLHLAARSSQAEQIDRDQSSISLRINDQPLATYSLAKWNSSHAKVRIPQSLWRANAWVMDFEVRLVPRQLKRCSYLVQEDYWVALDPETQLEAKYKHEEAAGIAGFWQRAMQRQQIQVAWNGSAGELPNEQQLASYTTMLQPLLPAASSHVPTRLELVNRSSCQEMACIVLHAHSTPPASATDVLAWKSNLSRLPQRAKLLPDLSAKGTAVIAWLEADSSQAEQLHFVLGAPSDTPVAAPALASLNGSFAVHSDQWHLFSDQASFEASLSHQAPTTGENVSQQQGRLRWINLIWATVSLLIIAGFALVYWRKKRKPDPKTWEVQ
jgi:Bacterial cellulose synthase subunit